MGTAYPTLVQLHSLNRYAVMALAAFVLIYALMGWFNRKSWDKLANATSGALVGLTHLQLLLGLILYFISPYALAGNSATRTSDPWQRYFTMEHITAMIIFVVLIQLGRTFSKKAADDTEKYKKLAMYTGIAVVVLLGGLGYKGLILGSKG